MGSNTIQTLQVIKIGALTGEVIIIAIMVIYLIFSFILTRRIKIMNLNLTTPYGKFFVKISKIHTIATLAIIILALLSIKP